MNKTFFLIVGSPRSGSSAIAQLLEQLGVHFGDHAHFIDPAKTPHNPIFYELEWVNHFNDLIFKSWNCAYKDDVLPIDADFQDPQMAAFAQSLREQLLREFGDRPVIGVKDPRICFTMPLWRTVIADLGYQLKLVFTLRRPSAVMKSIYAITFGRANRMRRHYVAHLLAGHYFTCDLPVCHFDYDELMHEPIAYARQKAAELGLAIDDPAATTRHLSPQHYHHPADTAGSGSPWVDQIDSDLRAGRLDPRKYLTYREIALLFTDELQALQNLPSTEANWLRQHQQLLGILRPGGQFHVSTKPDGTLAIKRIRST
jgi:hypothetical protein